MPIIGPVTFGTYARRVRDTVCPHGKRYVDEAYAGGLIVIRATPLLRQLERGAQVGALDQARPRRSKRVPTARTCGC